MIPADLGDWQRRFGELRAIAEALSEALMELRWEADDLAREFVQAMPDAAPTEECMDLLSLAGYDAVLSEIDGAQQPGEDI